MSAAKALASRADLVAAALAAIDALPHTGTPLADAVLYDDQGFPK
jgi:hypothetical protein